MEAVEDGRAAGRGAAIGGGPELGGVAELIGIAVAALVLFITFRAMGAAGLPLISALIGLGAGVCAIVAVGMSTTTITLALILDLAVGIAYAPFIVSHYRAEPAQRQTPEEAEGPAPDRPGPNQPWTRPGPPGWPAPSSRAGPTGRWRLARAVLRPGSRVRRPGAASGAHG
ncbi:MMPL family transporter [Streptomyces goshikiensis]|uniref:MMPL family transporter n=1 Tax=Streptomyces goshikiensis TaxID=1942 RepID=UPI0036BE8502